MKKILSIMIIAFLFLTNINNVLAVEVEGTDITDEPPEYCSIDYVGPLTPLQIETCATYNIDVWSLADLSEYTRIEKIEGIWYGVIDVTDLNVSSAWYGIDAYMSVIGITFTRDTQNLQQIVIDYVTVDNSCTGIVAFDKWCLGSTADSYEDTIILNNEYNTSDFLDFLRGDEIIVGNDDYDYYLYIDGPEVASVTVVQFTYILADQEVIDLRLDIQEQYEMEKQIILNNPILTDEEKLIQIVALIEEYKEYQIDFNDEITSICIGEQCTAINENPISDSLEDINWLDGAIDDIISAIFSFLILMGSAIAGIGFVAVIAYLLVVKATKTTGNVTLGFGKASAKSGMFWGNKVGTGILLFFTTIWEGIKALPWWATLVLLFIFLLSLSLLFL